MPIMDKNVAYVSNRYAELFQRLGELSDGARPPGRNAANGWFREHLLRDPQMQRVAHIAADDHVTLKSGSEADHLFECYLIFADGTIRAFREHPNAHGDIRLRIIWDNLEKLIDAIVAVAEGIISIAALDGPALAAAVARTKADIENIVKDVNAKGLVYDGDHMNGWMASSMAAVAIRDTLVPLDKYIPPGTNSEAGRITEVVRRAMRAIEAQNNRSFDPWLDAQWQIGFQSAMSSGAVALKAMMS